MKKRTVLALLCLAVLAPGAGAQSTSTAALSRATLNEVVVSARQPQEGFVADDASGALKTDTPLIETPASVTVVTREQMDERNVQTLGQIVRYSPGVAAETQGADHRNDSNTYIRGFLADRYLDGLKVQQGSFSFPTVDPYFLQSAEVLYGPNSILYGNASPGGILNLVSKTPEATPFHEVQLQFGNDDLFQGAFDATGPLDKDGHFLYRLTGLGRTTGSSIDYLRYQRLEIAPEIAWKPDADTKLTVIVNVLNDPQDGSLGTVFTRGTLLPNPNGTVPRTLFTGDPDFTKFDREQYSLAYQFERKLGDALTLRQNFRYLSQQLDYRDVYYTSLQADLHTLNRDAFQTWENQNSVALDTQLEGRFDTGPVKHVVLGGLDYQNLVYARSYIEAAAPSLDAFHPAYAPVSLNPNGPLVSHTSAKTSIDQVGLYAQDQLNWDRWYLDLGGREDWYQSTNDNRISGVTNYLGSQASTMRTGLLYKTGLGLAPYFNYAQSFQPQTGTDFGGNAFAPTRGEQEEVGIKYKPNMFDALFTLAFYNLDQTNVTSADPVHPGALVQTGKVRSQGMELGVTASPVKGLNLSGGYSYTDNRVMAATGAMANTVGRHPVTQPENRASLWGDYTFQDGWLKGFGLGSGVRYVGSSWDDTLNQIKIPDYLLVDAAVHYDFGPSFPGLAGLRAALNVSNLLDRNYVVAGNAGSLVTLAGNAWYGEGRSIQGVLTYRW